MAGGEPDLLAELQAYYGDDTARPVAGPLVSKSGETPGPNPGSTAGSPLPAELYEDRAIVVLALRLDGYSYEEIEQKTGLSMSQIRNACRKARQAGKLRDVLDLVDNEAVPQAVDNLVKLLRENDRQATFEVLKGRGVLRRFSGDKIGGGAVGGIPPLQINILTPAGGEMPTVIVNSERGAVIGQPREDTE